jgi:polyhydroxyalkanoate synthesis regulator phasin
MADNDQIHKKFLEDQLRWCKERNYILEEIEIRLYEMKSIAEYAAEQELSSVEIESLNGQLNELKNEVFALEKQLHTVVH